MCCHRTAVSVLCPFFSASQLQSAALAERRPLGRIVYFVFYFQGKLSLSAYVGLREMDISFQGYCLVTGSMGQMISYRDKRNLLQEVVGEVVFFPRWEKRNRGRKGREERASLDSIGEQRRPWFSTFPSSHFVWELGSKCSLLVPVVCENH